MTINYQVTNTDKIAGVVAVVAFVTSDSDVTDLSGLFWQVPGAPLQQLFGFQKVILDPRASADLLFAATRTTFVTVDEQGHKTLHRGNYRVNIET